MGFLVKLIPWLVKNLPAILALFSGLFGAGAAMSYHQSYQQHVAASASQPGLSAPSDQLWWQYVGGSAGGGLVAAGAFASAQSRNTKAHAALDEREELEAVFGKVGIAELEASHQARILQARMNLLPASAIVKGQ